ncbi:Endoribonuclease [Aphelenchoides bicaudatus]|nr:Endoribonuclease [Aphelenchoides bicaudatus]
MQFLQTAATLLFLLNFCRSQQQLPNFDISNEEIVRLVNEMRAADSNKARPGQIQLDYQGHTGSADSEDRAQKPLFKNIDSSLLRKPTYEALLKLQDNFERQTGVAEVNTAEEAGEVDNFLTLILNTQPWSVLGKFLKSKGHPFAQDKATMKRWLNQLWFEQYSRARGQKDTSGFEHIFIGESKNGEVSGLHNWLRFYILERASSVDYKGFLVKRGVSCKSVGIIKSVFSHCWEQLDSIGEIFLKSSGTILIGTSPEFEMALYLLCFLSRRGRNTCDFELDGCPMQITSYDIRQNRNVFIGSAFPSAGRMTGACRANA